VLPHIQSQLDIAVAAAAGVPQWVEVQAQHPTMLLPVACRHGRNRW
jgi:hypothetical protein